MWMPGASLDMANYTAGDMKSIFIDCNDQLDQVWAKVIRPDDPKIDVNTAPFKREELPLVLAGYDIALDDHSYMPTELVERCKSLKHIVFLGTGAASYMNIAELTDRGITVHTIKGYGDIAVAEHTMALMLACRPQRRAHGPRSALRHLVAVRGLPVLWQDARPDRPRRHRRRGRAHGARLRHEGHRL